MAGGCTISGKSGLHLSGFLGGRKEKTGAAGKFSPGESTNETEGAKIRVGWRAGKKNSLKSRAVMEN